MASSSSTAVLTAASGQQKWSLEQRISDLVDFLWSSKDFTIMGRTPISWGKLLLFYLCFYIFVSAFFAGMCAVFWQSLDWNFPKLKGPDSLLKGNPGLGYRPMPNIHSSLIRFVKGDSNSYSTWVDHIDAYLQYYENEYQETDTGSLVDCDAYNERRPVEQWDMACRFDISINLGADCIKQQAYGFDDGQPCILLKINRVFDWVPEEYDENSIPDEIRDVWQPWWVTVQCKGESPADEDNMGPIEYIPENGFHYKYFPFRNQQGYRSPLVWLHFLQPEVGIIIMVECKIYAKNIYHNRMEQAGMVHLELLVDAIEGKTS